MTMKIDHIAIWTNNLERLRIFYETYFGGLAGDKYLNPTKRFESYFLSFNDGARLEIMTRHGLEKPSANQPAAGGLAHFAIRIGCPLDVDRLAERLRQDGYSITGGPRWTGDGYYEGIVLDPDGNQVEFTAGNRQPIPGLTLRDLEEADCEMIEAAFTAQGWNKPAHQYQTYYNEWMFNKRDIILALHNGQFAGYITIYWESAYTHFREAGIPEIMDFNVLKRFQRQGIGAALMDEAERRIALRSPVAGLGVGLLSDYGAAQTLYARRGYVPDGNGVYYHDAQCKYFDQVKADDDLVLYLTKRL